MALWYARAGRFYSRICWLPARAVSPRSGLDPKTYQPKAYSAEFMAMDGLMGDSGFTCPTRRAAKEWSGKVGAAPGGHDTVATRCSGGVLCVVVGGRARRARPSAITVVGEDGAVGAALMGAAVVGARPTSTGSPRPPTAP